MGLARKFRERILEKVGRRNWSDEQVSKIVGSHRGVYFTYAQESLRQKSSSGGSVTALLVHLIESGVVDGALVLYSEVVAGEVQCRFRIATNRDEIIRAQGSKYMAVHFKRDAVPLIRAFPGRVAVVALPCDCTALARLRSREPELDQKVRLVVGLFCSHNSEPELTKLVVSKLTRGRRHLQEFHYRSGHWRGHLTASFPNGEELKRPFGMLAMYRHSYFYCQRKCHHCYDHFAYNCDIAAGDIWMLAMRSHPIKHTALITRTEAGEEALAKAQQAGVITSSSHNVREVLDGQARSAPFHHNVSARARVAPFFGLTVRDELHQSVPWNHLLGACIALAAERFSHSRLGRRVLPFVPPVFFRGLAYVVKALESF